MPNVSVHQHIDLLGYIGVAWADSMLQSKTSSAARVEKVELSPSAERNVELIVYDVSQRVPSGELDFEIPPGFSRQDCRGGVWKMQGPRQRAGKAIGPFKRGPTK
jgi:hypothetical protein